MQAFPLCLTSSYIPDRIRWYSCSILAWLFLNDYPAILMIISCLSCFEFALFDQHTWTLYITRYTPFWQERSVFETRQTKSVTILITYAYCGHIRMVLKQEIGFVILFCSFWLVCFEQLNQEEIFKRTFWNLVVMINTDLMFCMIIGLSQSLSNLIIQLVLVKLQITFSINT